MLPASNGLKHPPPLEMVGVAPSYLISMLPKPLHIVETFHSFPLGTLFSSRVISTIFFFFTCLLHGSSFYPFLKVGSSLFGPFLYICSRVGDHPYSVFQVLESLLSPSSQITCFHYYLCFYWSQGAIGNNKEYE